VIDMLLSMMVIHKIIKKKWYVVVILKCVCFSFLFYPVVIDIPLICCLNQCLFSFSFCSFLLFLFMMISIVYFSVIIMFQFSSLVFCYCPFVFMFYFFFANKWFITSLIVVFSELRVEKKITKTLKKKKRNSAFDV